MRVFGASRSNGRVIAQFGGAGPHIGRAASAPPLGNRLRVDPVPPGERPQALLTILYCSTDCRCRAGAPVKNLAYSASFHPCIDNAPSNSGTKHLNVADLKVHSEFKIQITTKGSPQIGKHISTYWGPID